ncbi:DinB family protein [Persicitalea sp.]|uniref:DinB family protein n=1 Tax=Persicitalea sp. TaxID=3100273 RepID=UPI003593D9AB
MNAPLTPEFKAQSLHYLHMNTPRIVQCLDLLSEAEVWQRPNASSNSVGNLILHLCGNIRQYIVSGLGKQPDDRERDAEFAAAGGFTKEELLQKLEVTVQEAAKVIEALDQGNLLSERVVQGFSLTGVAIVIHVVEHYSYHAGQIAFWTKLLKDKDLAFYGDRDLNAKNTF